MPPKLLKEIDLFWSNNGNASTFAFSAVPVQPTVLVGPLLLGGLPYGSLLVAAEQQATVCRRRCQLPCLTTSSLTWCQIAAHCPCASARRGQAGASGARLCQR